MHWPNCHNEMYKTHIRLCSLIPISGSCHTARAECFVVFFFTLCVADLPYDLNLAKCIEAFQWCNLV